MKPRPSVIFSSARWVRLTATSPFAVTRKKRFARPPRSGVGSPRCGFYVSLGFQTIKSGVNGTDGHLTTGAEFNLLPYSDSVGLISQAE